MDKDGCNGLWKMIHGRGEGNGEIRKERVWECKGRGKDLIAR